MDPKIVRPAVVIVFLISIQVVLTFWSVVGGDYHLQLMFWPWKFGLTTAAAALIAAITAGLLRDNGGISKRTVICAALLFAVIVTAGMVTYYYHLNEPTDEDQPDQQTTFTMNQ